MRWLTILSGCVLALAGTVEQGHAQPKPGPAVLKQFEGMWRITGFELGGKQILTKEEKTRTMTIEGSRWAVWQKGKLLWAGTVKVVDAKSDPVKVDLVSTIRNDKEEPGEVVQAIWRVKGGILHTAGAFSGKDRPTDFPTVEGSQWTHQRWTLLTD